jgi:hypothetical protein
VGAPFARTAARFPGSLVLAPAHPPLPLPHPFFSYWKGQLPEAELIKVRDETEATAWKIQKDAGIELVGLDGTLYDQASFFLC